MRLLLGMHLLLTACRCPQGRHLLENNITVNEHLSDIMQPRATAPRILEHPLNLTSASGVAEEASPSVQAHRMLRLL